MSRRLAIAVLAALFAAGAAWAGQITLQQAIDKVEHETNGKVLSA